MNKSKEILLFIAVFILLCGYGIAWLTGPWPQPQESLSFLDHLSVEEFLKYASVNINTATQKELIELPGIGEELADAIVEYRMTYGPFSSANDLLNVPGIGVNRLEAIKIYLYTG